MSSCLILTLEEMLKIALGSTPYGHIQLAVLHSFLKIIIEKLKIGTEFVEISGPEIKIIRDMLCRAEDPQINFEACADEKTESDLNILKMEEEINKLSERINKTESDLNQHLEAMEQCKKPPVAKPLHFRRSQGRPFGDEDSSFSSDCEDLCVPCDENNLIACNLLQNQAFLKKLMRRVTSPVIDRIFEFEKMISILNEKFQNFLNTAQDEYQKIPLIENCFSEIRAVKNQLDKHQNEFIETMEEIQEMMDAKLDKLHMPALKKYIIDRMSEINKKLETVIKNEQCPKAAGVILTHLQCLCCTTQVCQKDKDFTVPLLAGFKGSKARPAPTNDLEHPHFCIPEDRPRACGGEHTVIRPEEKTLHKSNLLDDFGDQLNLPYYSNKKLKLFKGFHGKMYREG
ncbi:uncharacterized protein LOC129944347 [Eupeodes corollae]|uniref:uncharacterized protein LOC129944347 n=1 Tax=Eupeodes corollae TaxID=290404 RepID=UPI002491B080|nr:uncharacterized protein LOC129944347 [Eupeodes corollae]